MAGRMWDDADNDAGDNWCSLTSGHSGWTLCGAGRAPAVLEELTHIHKAISMNEDIFIIIIIFMHEW